MGDCCSPAVISAICQDLLRYLIVEAYHYVASVENIYGSPVSVKHRQGHGEEWVAGYFFEFFFMLDAGHAGLRKLPKHSPDAYPSRAG